MRHEYSLAMMDHLFWRLWWAPANTFTKPGLYFALGLRQGAVRLWGTAFLMQIAIVAVTVPGVWLIGEPAEARLGFFLLLVSQPLWLLATWRAGQFGMFVMALFYSALWVRALVNHL